MEETPNITGSPALGLGLADNSSGAASALDHTLTGDV
jgi:hypothetical protein